MTDFTRLRFAAKIVAGQSPISGELEEIGTGLPFLQGNAEFGVSSPLARWECNGAPKKALEGDVLVSVRAPVGAVNIADKDYGIGRGLCAVRPQTGNLRYFYYWLQSVTEELNSIATGSIFPAISSGDLGDLRVPISDEAVQSRVADVLDHETAGIDAFIADQEELIRLLAERRAATINHAVTKGLDPNVPMKDSGVEWLGEVPEHWAIRSATAVGRAFGSEPVGEEDLNADGGMPFLKVSTLSARSFSLGTIEWFADRPVPRRSPAAFVVFPKRGAAIFGNKVNIVTHAALLDPNLMGWEIRAGYCIGYFAYVLKTLRLEEIADVSTVPQINVKHLSALRVPIPPKAEQLQIFAHLNHEIAELDAAMADAREAISLSRERRAALISAAVTGKIDVREHGAVA